MRQIDETPHQMGGMRCVVQGDDDSVVSFGSHLLIQLGSDQGMSLIWGDLGALYVRAPSNNFWRRRFNGIHGWIDCH